MKKEIVKKEENVSRRKESETTPEKDLWADLNPATRMALEKIIENLIPYGLAKVETGTTDEGVPTATVRKTSDKSVIYYTEAPSEIEVLQEFEIIQK